MLLSSIFAVLFLENNVLVDINGYHYTLCLDVASEIGFHTKEQAEQAKEFIVENHINNEKALKVVEIKSTVGFV